KNNLLRFDYLESGENADAVAVSRRRGKTTRLREGCTDEPRAIVPDGSACLIAGRMRRHRCA
ncbi:MAG: hypothetical protein KAJ11_09185, partial [Alphaproteobacteria bacterium]|nr:hypothetical protein [Alphaproteobacteria bacterium]